MEEPKVISLQESIKMGDIAKGKRSKYIYIKPQSPIHSPCDPWNASQEYQLITWEDLIRNYQYSCLEGRYYNAYTDEEIELLPSGVAKQ